MGEKESRDDTNEAKEKVQQFTNCPVRKILPKNKYATENKLAIIHAKQHWLF
jgi:hypothetical protein